MHKVVVNSGNKLSSLERFEFSIFRRKKRLST